VSHSGSRQKADFSSNFKQRLWRPLRDRTLIYQLSPKLQCISNLDANELQEDLTKK